MLDAARAAPLTVHDQERPRLTALVDGAHLQQERSQRIGVALLAGRPFPGVLLRPLRGGRVVQQADEHRAGLRGSRPRTRSIPSSVHSHVSDRWSCWAIAVPSRAATVTRRTSPVSRSSCDAVACDASSTHSASLAAVATPHSARTFEYESRPSAKAAVVSGRPPSSRATAMWARAVDGAIPAWIDSQCSMLTHSHASNPRRRSYSASISSHRHVAAARCAANVVISASSRSVASPSSSPPIVFAISP